MTYQLTVRNITHVTSELTLSVFYYSNVEILTR